MPYQKLIWINIPVRDLDVSIKFYAAIGLTQNPMFSTADGSMMSWTTGDEPAPINLMLLSRPFYEGFLPSGVARVDPTKAAQCILCFNSPTKEEVDRTVEKAKGFGARVDIRQKTEIEKQMESVGMYSRIISDPDGHIIELMYMPAVRAETKIMT